MKTEYTEDDYKKVLNHILKSWSDGTLPDTYTIMNDLKNNKKLMDKEFNFINEMKGGLN